MVSDVFLYVWLKYYCLCPFSGQCKPLTPSSIFLDQSRSPQGWSKLIKMAKRSLSLQIKQARYEFSPLMILSINNALMILCIN